jgi:hypothetical protein
MLLKLVLLLFLNIILSCSQTLLHQAASFHMEQFGPLPPEDTYLSALETVSLSVASTSFSSSRGTGTADESAKLGKSSSKAGVHGCPSIKLALLTVVDEDLSRSAVSLIKALSSIKTPVQGYESSLPSSPCPRHDRSIDSPSSAPGVVSVTKPLDQLQSTFKKGITNNEALSRGSLDAALLVVCTDVKALEACEELQAVAAHRCKAFGQ